MARIPPPAEAEGLLRVLSVMDAERRAQLRAWGDPELVRQDAEIYTPADVIPLLDALDAALAEVRRLERHRTMLWTALERVIRLDGSGVESVGYSMAELVQTYENARAILAATKPNEGSTA